MYVATLQLKIFMIISMLFICWNIAVGKQDFSNVKGHLEKLGSGRPNSIIDTVDGFPSVEDFFTNYVHKWKPVKMSGAVKGSFAQMHWTDDYFLSLAVPSDNTVLVESRKKEDRKKPAVDIHFHKFLKRYNSTDEYMVQSIPDFLGKDIVLPLPLQCEELYSEKLLDGIVWFSSGGTKSVLHTDSVDNLNCLYHGEKEFVMIDPSKYEEKVDIDHPEGAYSDVDVDRVDFEKYPGLAEVEYIVANLTAGDCLYIPYKWIHQVRSYHRNIAVNVWWDHHGGRQVDISKCTSKPDPTLTLDKVEFHTQGYGVSVETIREYFLEITKKGNLPVETYYGMFLSDMPLVDEDDTLPHMVHLKQVSSILDKDADGNISREEVESITDENWNVIKEVMQRLEELVESLEEKMEEQQREASHDYEFNDLLPNEDDYDEKTHDEF